MIVNINLLLNKIKEYRKRYKKIIMTNGCFDIIHPGHIEFLYDAKKLGNLLIVAVNSDNSVKVNKGNSRPINKLNSRMTILSAIKPVDYVISFGATTPLKLITKIKPDILVKGGDYKINEIVGSTEVLSYGGKVKTLSYNKSFSSSKVIDMIKNLN